MDLKAFLHWAPHSFVETDGLCTFMQVSIARRLELVSYKVLHNGFPALLTGTSNRHTHVVFWNFYCQDLSLFIPLYFWKAFRQDLSVESRLTWDVGSSSLGPTSAGSVHHLPESWYIGGFLKMRSLRTGLWVLILAAVSVCTYLSALFTALHWVGNCSHVTLNNH